jgi:chemotaxis protein methyltransferase CheR
MQLRWAGFRKVRSQVCKRIQRRYTALGLADWDAYRAFLDRHPEEWEALRPLCRVTITRLYRDRATWDELRTAHLPELRRHHDTLHAWSAGCASGEEPYTLAMLALLDDIPLRITATDFDPVLLERATHRRFPLAATHDLPQDLRDRFVREIDDKTIELAPEVAEPVEFLEQDLRLESPPGPFDLISCKNSAFTYFAEDLQLEVACRMHDRLKPHGLLVTGRHEAPPLQLFTPLAKGSSLYRPS